MDDVTWAALTLTLTLVGVAYSWWAFRHRGVAPGLRGLALTGLPPAAWLTGTSQMFGEIASSMATWATQLVFSPIVWAGLGIAGVSVLLYFSSRVIDARGASQPRRIDQSRSRPGATPPGDTEFAEIEALLRNKGIE